MIIFFELKINVSETLLLTVVIVHETLIVEIRYNLQIYKCYNLL